MTDIISEVRKMYDEYGEYFSKTREKRYGGSSSNWPITQKYLDKIGQSEKILDLGCGSGRLLSGLPDGVEYVGVDFSKTLLKVAKDKYPNKKFILAEMTDETLWKKLTNYKAVFMVASLHHLPDRKSQISVLKKIKEVLKPNGFLFLSVWNLFTPRMISKLEGLELEVGKMVEIPFNGGRGRFVMAMDKTYLKGLFEELAWEIKIVSQDFNLSLVAKK